MRKTIMVGLAVLAAATFTAHDTARAQGAELGPFTEMSAPDNEDLQDILSEHWELTLSENPVFATSVGVRRFDDELGDPSLEAETAATRARERLHDRLSLLDPDDLSAADRLNRDLLLFELEQEIEGAQHGGRYLTITSRSGPHLFLTGLPTRLPFRTTADYRSYAARLSAIPGYLEAVTERMRTGIAEGWVQPCAAMEGFERSIHTHVVKDPGDSVFMRPFEDRPDGVPEATFETLTSEARATVRDEVVPAFRDFESFYLLEYQPACREAVGIDSVPGGKEYYAHLVEHYTTVEIDPFAVYDIGVAEVARIRAEMEEIAEAEGFEDLAAYQEHLRTDPQYYPKTAEERLERAAWISKKMDGQLVNLFTVLPRMPYDIREIPLDIAEKTSTAYYSQPSGDGSRAGTYWVNTTKLDTRPLYELEALSLHEAVPGHHLQIALAQELDLPSFRRHGGTTAFIEGWALYSESLGAQVGFYETPATKFGQLSYEMWRATRLVVDTGMHSLGMSRQEAIDYMLANTGLSRNNIETEVDRYITWPGQALAYKMGELKIRELKEEAQRVLGDRFDQRRFHDAVLGSGPVPLAVLETIIDDWVQAELARG